MEKGKTFSIKARIRSFKYAFQGVGYLLKNEHNVWIHLTVAAGVVAAGFLLGISPAEWIAVVFAIGFVLAAEAFNTAIEALSNAVSTDYNEFIRHSKDVAAAGVVIAALTAVVIGLIVFLPKIITLFLWNF